ncbi:MAG: TolC family protein [Terriglobia bacterium]
MIQADARRWGAVLGTMMLIAQLAPASLNAQQPLTQHAAQATDIHFSRGTAFPNIFAPYGNPVVPEPRMSNTELIHTLIRDGKMQLSVDDAIALALQNNLDIAVQRYNIAFAQTDLLRAQAGGATRGVTGAFQSAAEFRGAIGGGVSSGGGGGNVSAGGSSGSGGAFSFSGSGCCDPVAQFSYGWNQDVTPLGISLLQGVSTLTQHTAGYSWYLGDGFLTGTSVGFGFFGERQSSNSVNTLFNPLIASEMVVGVVQPLLNGFGYRVNARFIRIAHNQIKIADSVFRQQVITTLSAVLTAYWNLVSARDTVNVSQSALDLSEKTLSDLQEELKLGVIAQFDVVRARSEVASRKQDLIVAQTTQDDQQQILKAAIAKDLNKELEAAEIVPTDALPEPKPDDIPSVEEALRIGMEKRPEIEQSDLNLRIQEINVQNTRNELLPSLNAFATYAPTGLSGASSVVGVVPGGAGTVLSQTFRNQFPDYSLGMTFTVPIRNREGQADAARTLLEERQLRVQLQQKKNQVIQDVHTAVVDVTQAKAQMEAARAATALAQETLDGEQQKFKLGESTIFLVIQDQRDLFTAKGNEVKARTAYVTALVRYRQATATTLDQYHVVLADAKSGHASRVPNIPGAPIEAASGN